MSLLYSFILALYWAQDSSEETLINYQSLHNDDFSIHPLASTSLSLHPPITIEVTPFNDTLINVYFASTPQHLAILIHLKNSPHPLNTAYSSILIATNPAGDPPVYSGTITFIATAENSTVGFRIPPSPNGAVITIDVPKGPVESDANARGGKTKIRLIHLGSSSTQQPPTMATTNTWTTITPDGEKWTTASPPPSNVTVKQMDTTFSVNTSLTTSLATTLSSILPEMSTSKASSTERSTFVPKFTEKASITPDDIASSSQFSTQITGFTSHLPNEVSKSTLETVKPTDIIQNSTDDLTDKYTNQEMTVSTESFLDDTESVQTTVTPIMHTTRPITVPVTPTTHTTMSSRPTAVPVTPIMHTTMSSRPITVPVTPIKHTTMSSKPITVSVTPITHPTMSSKPTAVPVTPIKVSPSPLNVTDDIATPENTSETFTTAKTTRESTTYTYDTDFQRSSTTFEPDEVPLLTTAHSTTTEKPSTGFSSTTETFNTLTTLSVRNASPTTTTLGTTKERDVHTRSTSASVSTMSTTAFPTARMMTPNTVPGPPRTTPTQSATVNTTCPTLYNIFFKLNLSASFNKTKVDSPSRGTQRATTTAKQLPTVLATTTEEVGITQHDEPRETASPRKFPQPSSTVDQVSTGHSNESTVTKVATTVTPMPTQPSTTTFTTPVSSTVHQMAPTSYWLISIILAQGDVVNSTFVEQMIRTLEEVFDEAYKRLRLKPLGLYTKQLRFKRSGHTFAKVEMINVTKTNQPLSGAVEMVYYLVNDGTFLPVNSSLDAMELLDDQEAALLFGHVVVVKAKPYIQTPTSEPYKDEKKSDMLPIILGSVAGLLMMIVVIIILLKSKCVTRKSQTEEDSPPSPSLGERNRIQALDDENMSVVIEGGAESSSASKLTAQNVLPKVSTEVETQPPPPPLKPRLKRPVPTVPGDYTNVLKLDTEIDHENLPKVPSKRFTTLKHHQTFRAGVYSNSEGPGGLLEYLKAPLSKSPAEMHADRTIPCRSHDQHSINDRIAYEGTAVATQTDHVQQLEERRPSSHSDHELDAEVIGSEIQWQTVKRKMQEMIDEAVAIMKNKKPSPRFRRSRLQPMPLSGAHVETSVNTDTDVPAPETTVHQLSPLKKRLESPVKRGHTFEETAQLHSPCKSDVSAVKRTNLQPDQDGWNDLDLDHTHRRRPKDSETAYLIQAIKEELQNFKQNFSTPFDAHSTTQHNSHFI